MAAELEFKTETVENFQKIYAAHKDCIQYKLRFGSAVEKAIAKTILAAAGVTFDEGGCA